MPTATDLFATSSLLATVTGTLVLLFCCLLIWQAVDGPPAQRKYVLDVLERLRDLLAVLFRRD
jgi:hypothetical protein